MCGRWSGWAETGTSVNCYGIYVYMHACRCVHGGVCVCVCACVRVEKQQRKLLRRPKAVYTSLVQGRIHW